MKTLIPTLEQMAPDTFRFYREALQIMREAEIPCLLGGAYALAHYTGITRHTKDLDLFVRPADARRTLAAFASAGYRTGMIFTHWLGKVYCGNDFIDVIFNSGNGLCRVDDEWFEHAVDGWVLETETHLVPPEEMIWQKCYVMERERFDGADVLHLLRACGPCLDWNRLLGRFGPHWRVLLSHLVMFGFVYPDDRDSIPPRVLHNLTAWLHKEPETPGGDGVVNGPLLSRTQYCIDTEEWGYADPRLKPLGPLTAEQVERWTDAGR
jgi:hypothetical protein